MVMTVWSAEGPARGRQPARTPPQSWCHGHWEREVQGGHPPLPLPPTVTLNDNSDAMSHYTHLAMSYLHTVTPLVTYTSLYWR